MYIPSRTIFTTVTQSDIFIRLWSMSPTSGAIKFSSSSILTPYYAYIGDRRPATVARADSSNHSKTHYAGRNNGPLINIYAPAHVAMTLPLRIH